MVEFKININDPKTGKTHFTVIKDAEANTFISKKIGDEIDGIFVKLPGYKLCITGGSTKEGFPMRKDLPGSATRRLLLTKGIGMRRKHKGMRKKTSVAGNTISLNTAMINTTVVVYGPKNIVDALKSEDKSEKA